MRMAGVCDCSKTSLEPGTNQIKRYFALATLTLTWVNHVRVCYNRQWQRLVAETRPPFDTKFTQIKMNHCRVGKRQPRCGGVVLRRPIIVRSSDAAEAEAVSTLHWHALWTRDTPPRRVITQESRFSLLCTLQLSFRPGKNSGTICEVSSEF